MFKPSSQELRITTWCTSESFFGPSLTCSLLCTRSDVQRMRGKSRTLIHCQDPRSRGIAIRDSEGCFSVGGGSRMVGDCTVERRVVRSEWSVVVRDRDRRRCETRCCAARISTTGHRIICHDTKPHDRVRSKQHTRSRHAKACHFTEWSCISSFARHGRAEQGGDARTMIGDVYNLEKVCRLWAARV